MLYPQCCVQHIDIEEDQCALSLECTSRSHRTKPYAPGILQCKMQSQSLRCSRPNQEKFDSTIVLNASSEFVCYLKCNERKEGELRGT